MFSFKKEVYSSTGIKIGSYKIPEFQEVKLHTFIKKEDIIILYSVADQPALY